MEDTDNSGEPETWVRLRLSDDGVMARIKKVHRSLLRKPWNDTIYIWNLKGESGDGPTLETAMNDCNEALQRRGFNA